ncbi:uncharacterized protein LOC9657254 [Selaginella moellendorffii]|uniref:uncharacterized protein LOC9657254 n=1 Tax=Selaginella moellendorffii TaxID=88036 RepID=UPI000D1C9F63|nr:uncharacterized protein LOC9657254 [Selaginella moellendorffii]|eukprot:XP_024540363.1 uncharacterized protein LOC9657254 [Selaginella moellendorffii]
MEGFAVAMDLLEKMGSSARHCREVYQKLHNDDAAVIQRVEAMLSEAGAAVEEDRERMTGLLQDLKQEVDATDKMMARLKNAGVNDAELEALTITLKQIRDHEQDLEEETRVLKDEVNRIETRFNSLEAKKEELKKLEALQQHNTHELSLFAQVTRIVPDTESIGSSILTGSILDEQKRLRSEFKLNTTEKSEFETCRALWRMEV